MKIWVDAQLSPRLARWLSQNLLVDAAVVRMHGAPPQVLWITCGNTSNRHLKSIFVEAWPSVIELLRAGERLVEIGGPAK